MDARVGRDPGEAAMGGRYELGSDARSNLEQGATTAMGERERKAGCRAGVRPRRAEREIEERLGAGRTRWSSDAGGRAGTWARAAVGDGKERAPAMEGRGRGELEMEAEPEPEPGARRRVEDEHGWRGERREREWHCLRWSARQAEDKDSTRSGTKIREGR
jgi:hypothetical protein